LAIGFIDDEIVDSVGAGPRWIMIAGVPQAQVNQDLRDHDIRDGIRHILPVQSQKQVSALQISPHIINRFCGILHISQIAPFLNITAEMNISARHGSNCLFTILQSPSNIEYGFLPINSKGLLMPNLLRYLIAAGPTLGISLSLLMSVLFPFFFYIG
jgi:hypothetical protein